MTEMSDKALQLQDTHCGLMGNCYASLLSVLNPVKVWIEGQMEGRNEAK